MQLLAYSVLGLLLAAVPALSSNNKEVFLSMLKFEQVADRAHALYASVDLELSHIFYDSMDNKMHGINIDSSTNKLRN